MTRLNITRLADTIAERDAYSIVLRDCAVCGDSVYDVFFCEPCSQMLDDCAGTSGPDYSGPLTMADFI